MLKMAKALSLNADSKISEFKVGNDLNEAAIRWKEWIEDFSDFVGGSGITDGYQKKCLLKHYGGEDLKKLLKTLPNTGTPQQYDHAVTALNTYFEEHEGDESVASIRFRRAVMEPGESMDRYEKRLRELIKWCNYPEDLVDRLIKEQIFLTCEEELLKKFLTMKNKALDKCLEVARAWETAKRDSKEVKKTEENVYAMKTGTPRSDRWSSEAKKSDTRGSSSGTGCFRCGSHDHYAKKCERAKNEKCYKCKKLGHFQKMCRSKSPSSQGGATGRSGGSRQGGHQRGRSRAWNRGDRVKYARDESGSEEDTYYVFAINKHAAESLTIDVNGTPLNVVIDSGSGVNIISTDQWKRLKKEAHLDLEPTRKKIYPYGSMTPLPLKGQFTANVYVEENGASLREVPFIVTNVNGVCLLSKKTAMALDVLRVGANHVQAVSDIKDKEEVKKEPKDKETNKIKKNEDAAEKSEEKTNKKNE